MPDAGAYRVQRPQPMQVLPQRGNVLSGICSAAVGPGARGQQHAQPATHGRRQGRFGLGDAPLQRAGFFRQPGDAGVQGLLLRGDGGLLPAQRHGPVRGVRHAPAGAPGIGLQPLDVQLHQVLQGGGLAGRHLGLVQPLRRREGTGLRCAHAAPRTPVGRGAPLVGPCAGGGRIPETREFVQPHGFAGPQPERRSGFAQELSQCPGRLARGRGARGSGLRCSGTGCIGIGRRGQWFRQVFAHPAGQAELGRERFPARCCAVELVQFVVGLLAGRGVAGMCRIAGIAGDEQGGGVGAQGKFRHGVRRSQGRRARSRQKARGGSGWTPHALGACAVGWPRRLR